MTDLAIYDMDRTITRTGTYTPFLLHAARRLAPWRLLLAPAAFGAMVAYAAKLIDRKRLKEINHSLLLGDHLPAAALRPVTAAFAELIWKTNIHPGALTQIEEDRAAGRRLVLATASYRLYVEAIAAKLGFDDVIATNSLYGLDDRIRAKVDGENCYGPAKLRMIEAWLAAQGIERGAARIRFYSDHVSDAPVLEWADEPFAVNASARLRRLAGERGWPLVNWGL
ncbi:HAD-IB family hydrolase [Sphingomonas oleivorans]|uniref:HAD-IB family hydrolase n=1 Tax=Sphingomonas oleivorans TaxID=1735121 RepID=A0A2T5FXM2_9SPHN|nr:HAD-IB family hydrolase [Sphingomonas oleivorans]PTQ10834.1 HAD-IB family hydrolase [Sphingomonas oleivorans]